MQLGCNRVLEVEKANTPEMSEREKILAFIKAGQTNVDRNGELWFWSDTYIKWVQWDFMETAYRKYGNEKEIK